jgi:hypothetical protein
MNAPGAKVKAAGTRALTSKIKELAAEVHDRLTEDGDVVTKAEALARLLWKKALGSTEKTRDDAGNLKEVTHKPEAWAIALLYERMEGRVAQAMPEEGSRMKASAKVRELAKERLNQMATAAAGSEAKGPPKHKAKKEKAV